MDTKFWKQLGIVLRDQRISMNMTQQQLADKVHKTRNCITNWESGRRSIDIIDLIQLCKALNVDANEVLEMVSKYVN